MFRPLCFLGVDLAYSRDTAAVSAVYNNRDWGQVVRYDHRIWEPPVHIPDVTDAVERFYSTQRVGGIYYDPYQWVGEVQRLVKNNPGIEYVLHEVNQQSRMTEISNNLATMIQRQEFIFYSDPQIRGQYTWCNAESTERGFRIVKKKQTRPIDIVVADAMAVWGAAHDYSAQSMPGYEEAEHEIPLEEVV